MIPNFKKEEFQGIRKALSKYLTDIRTMKKHQKRALTTAYLRDAYIGLEVKTVIYIEVSMPKGFDDVLIRFENKICEDRDKNLSGREKHWT